MGKIPRISIVITAHNEGKQLQRTVDSVRCSLTKPSEIIVVNDGSNDRYCDKRRLGNVQIIRHRKKIGVATSRHKGSQISGGRVIAYLDGHQRLSDGCLEECAKLALKRKAIVAPDIRDFSDNALVLRGATFVMRNNQPPFAAKWRLRAKSRPVSKVSSLCAPAYVIPKSAYPKVSWSPLLRGWGGSEACVSLKAFFTGVDILHLSGPLALHKFKKKFHYPVGWDEIWRNHALIARICFNETSWRTYWLPKVFQNHLNRCVLNELESKQVEQEHSAFQKLKTRPDHEFWTQLVGRKVPQALRRER